MNKTETVKTQDGQELTNGDDIWYVNGDSIHQAALRIGYHDQRYKIYKSKTMAQREADKFKIKPR